MLFCFCSVCNLFVLFACFVILCEEVVVVVVAVVHMFVFLFLFGLFWFDLVLVVFVFFFRVHLFAQHRIWSLNWALNSNAVMQVGACLFVRGHFQIMSGFLQNTAK